MIKYKITRHEKRVILDFMGIPYRDQPEQVPKLDGLLHSFSESQPEKFQRIFDLIVYHNIPDDASDKEKSFASVGELISDYLEPLTKASLSNIAAKEKELDGRLKELLKDISKQAETISVAAIEEAAKRFEKLEVRVGSAKPKVVESLVPDEFEKILQLAANRKNIMMVGPAGCGKTYLASVIADALDIDYAAQSCSAGMSESQLTGWLLPIGTAGQFEYVSSEFVRIYENGGVFLIDEIDASDPNVLIFINAAIAGDHFYLPQRFKKPRVDKHPDFVCVAASNTFGGGADALYNARNSLDASTLDRFRMGMIPMKYDDRVERNLAGDLLVEWGNRMRTKIAEHGMQKVLSTRVLIDASDMMAAGWSVKNVHEAYLADWSPEEKRACDTDFILRTVEM
jgi:MoxR-like ATPase